MAKAGIWQSRMRNATGWDSEVRDCDAEGGMENLRSGGRNQSEQRRKLSHFGGGSDEPQPAEGGEIVLYRDGRCCQPRSYLADGVAEGAWHQVKVIGKKVVGVLDFDSVGHDRGFWEVPQVRGDDHVAASDYCCCENMTVVGVGKVECGDNRFVSGDQAIPCCPIHEIARPFQGCSITVRFVADQGVDPLPMDVCGPFRAKEIVNGQLQKNIPHRCGIENVGVKESREGRHRGPYPISWA